MPVELTKESINIIIDDLQVLFDEYFGLYRLGDEDELFTRFVEYMEGQGVIELIKE